MSGTTFLRLLLPLALLAAQGAHAYCIHNQVPDRDVRIEQEEHPDGLRNDRRLRVTLKPGESKCCDFHQLDCNPGGRANSVVNLAIIVNGTPSYECSFPPGIVSTVKVTGTGTIRILPNPNKKSANPYIARIATQDKDLTGPQGIACAEPRKVEPKPKGKK